MKAFLKNTAKKWLRWSVENPKKFYMYSMIFLSVSLIISISQAIIFPSDMTFRIKPPILYSKSSAGHQSQSKSGKVVQDIVSELQMLKEKRDRGELLKEDSLRIEYLFNQYQNLKNEH